MTEHRYVILAAKLECWYMGSTESTSKVITPFDRSCVDGIRFGRAFMPGKVSPLKWSKNKSFCETAVHCTYNNER